MDGILIAQVKGARNEGEMRKLHVEKIFFLINVGEN